MCEHVFCDYEKMKWCLWWLKVTQAILWRLSQLWLAVQQQLCDLSSIWTMHRLIIPCTLHTSLWFVSPETDCNDACGLKSFLESFLESCHDGLFTTCYLVCFSDPSLQHIVIWCKCPHVLFNSKVALITLNMTAHSVSSYMALQGENNTGFSWGL